jgi:hypothetical protein
VPDIKKYFLWTFERGSKPYDVICLLILAFIFLTPRRWFDDRPNLQCLGQVSSAQPSCINDRNVSITMRLEKEAVDNLKALCRRAKNARTSLSRDLVACNSKTETSHVSFERRILTLFDVLVA